MISNNLGKGWYEQNTNGQRKRGGQKRYSDKAITICLQIRYMFGLKLRQTQGFINWLFAVTGLRLKCPDRLHNT
ncbi:MAG: transposase [Rickettsiaceae bacterium]|nr:transposase [Rickettsiaceae bacterium]